jgi:hypothetical protein
MAHPKMLSGAPAEASLPLGFEPPLHLLTGDGDTPSHPVLRRPATTPVRDGDLVNVASPTAPVSVAFKDRAQAVAPKAGAARFVFTSPASGSFPAALAMRSNGGATGVN